MDTQHTQIGTCNAFKSPSKKLFKYAIYPIVLSFLLLGCALSPQSITLSPVLNVAVTAQSQPQTIALNVLDLRPNRAFGTRGGVYDTALITPRTDVAQTLYRVLAERLRNGNFQLSDSIAAALPLLEVRIERIDYGAIPVIAGGILNEIKVNALISATVRNRGHVLSAQYQAASSRQINAYPSAEQNETLLNEVVGKALQSLLADQELLNLLRS